jgi:hypothetical protein
MEPWLAALYPIAFGYLAWVLRARPEGQTDPWEALPRVARAALAALALVGALASTVVAILGPAWIFQAFFQWPDWVAWPTGILIGLILFSGWVAWVATQEGFSGKPTLHERVDRTGSILAGCAIPVLFTVGQMISFALGALASYRLVQQVLELVVLDPTLEEGLRSGAGFLGGTGLMVGYVLLLKWWQDWRDEASR